MNSKIISIHNIGYAPSYGKNNKKRTKEKENITMANFNSIFNNEWTAYHVPKGGSKAYKVVHKIDGDMHYFLYDDFEITFVTDMSKCRLVCESYDGWINFWFSFDDKPRTIKAVCDYIDKMQRTSESFNSMIFKYSGFFEPFE